MRWLERFTLLSEKRRLRIVMSSILIQSGPSSCFLIFRLKSIDQCEWHCLTTFVYLNDSKKRFPTRKKIYGARIVLWTTSKGFHVDHILVTLLIRYGGAIFHISWWSIKMLCRQNYILDFCCVQSHTRWLHLPHIPKSSMASLLRS